MKITYFRVFVEGVKRIIISKHNYYELYEKFIEDTLIMIQSFELLTIVSL